jgi:uncharacterized protein YbjT (DUF2867 family)
MMRIPSLTMSNTTIFFLGGTGYLGSQTLIELARLGVDFVSKYHVVVLVRGPNLGKKESLLKEIYENLEVVEGSLDDEELIKDWCKKARIVINVASSDHFASVRGMSILLHS